LGCSYNTRNVTTRIQRKGKRPQNSLTENFRVLWGELERKKEKLKETRKKKIGDLGRDFS